MTRIKQSLLKSWFRYKYENLNLSGTCVLNKKDAFEGFNAVFEKTEFTNSFIGYGSYIANNSVIRKTKIGKFCAIGDNVRTYLGLHPADTYVSIHPAFFSPAKQAGFTFVKKAVFKEHRYVDKENKYVVEIGNDVWIGNNVMIMDGITISHGAIVAAGAVVTKNVPPYAVVGGVPAKLMKYRVTEDQIDFLLKLNWWDKEVSWLKKNAHLFADVNSFIKAVMDD